MPTRPAESPIEFLPAIIAVCADPPGDKALLTAAARLAVDLNLPFLEKPVKKGVEMLLVAAPGRLELRILEGDAQTRGGLPVAVDLAGVDTTSPAGKSLKQPIIKAVGIRSGKQLRNQPPTVIDATAGWGEDAWLLASLGCRVLMVERNKVMATLLRDGLLRAGVENPAALGRIHLLATDGSHMLRRIVRLREAVAHAQVAKNAADAGAANLAEEVEDLPAELRDFLRPDVVYLDPMYPGAGTRKTAERKPMRVLRRLVGDDADAGELFQWALRVAAKRVVVKRPLKAQPLSGPDGKPTVVHKGKSLRYDVYVTGRDLAADERR